MADTVTAASTDNVQHVTKKSSDELLRKFAELGGEEETDQAEKGMRRFKRRRRSRKTSRVHEVAGHCCESPSYYNGGSLVERRSLLPVSRKSELMKQLGTCRSQLKSSRDVKNRSFFATIGKTWRRTVEGASRVILETHYNRHRRLINDIV